MGDGAYERAQVVNAMRRWYTRHGKLPSQVAWDRSDEGSPPSARTIRRRWGWQPLLREILDEAGDDQKQGGWASNAMMDALIRARDETGRWPSRREWTHTTPEHPAGRSYVRRFGSWKAALGAAADRAASAPIPVNRGI